MKEFFPSGVFLSTSESHLLLCIKEGLELLGINVAATLFDSDLNIIDISYLCYLKPVWLDLINQLEDYQDVTDKTLFLSIADETGLHYIGSEDYWFLTPHLLNGFEYKKGIKIPWAFGFRQKLIDFYKNNQRKREYQVIRNFTNSGNQSIRESLDFILLPKLEKIMTVDRTKQDYEEYLLNLLSSRFCLAYGGNYSSDFTKNPWIMENQLKNIEIPFRFKQNTIILRWDSWRLWESWALGCIPIHLDFEKYGFRLPVMPTNWEHYIGLDLSNLENDVERLSSLSEAQLEDISRKGREWAWKHYSPMAVAERVLSLGIDKVLYGIPHV
jgi:hypothetical protein